MSQPKIVYEDVIPQLKKLIQFKTENPPGKTLDAIQYIANLFEEVAVPFEIHEYQENRAVLVAEVGKGDPSIVLTGHIDVVSAGDSSRWTYSPFAGKEVGSKIYGRGAVDMKGAVAAFIAIMKALKRSEGDLKQKIKLLITSDEESLMQGAKAALQENVMDTCELLIIGEPTGMDIGKAEKSVEWGRIKIEGESSHGAHPHQGVNAVEVAYDLFPEIKAIIPDDTHPLLGHSMINISRVEGGKPFMVPEYCEFDFDYRLIPNIEDKTIKTKLDQCIQHFNETHEAKAEVEYLFGVPAIEYQEDHPLIGLLQQKAQTHDRGKSIGLPYATDGGILIANSNIPFVIFGPGGRDKLHITDEWTEKQEVITYANILLEALIAYCSP